MVAVIFERPLAFLLLIPVVPLVVLLVRRRFVQVQEDEHARQRRTRLRGIVLVTRLVMAALLVTAAATPAIQRVKTVTDAPVVRMLADNSTSMALFTPIADQLEAMLSQQIGVERIPAGAGERSDLGDVLLGKLGPRRQLLLVSDGHATHGAALGDVAVLARQLNATVSAVLLEPRERDRRVSLQVPAKVVEGAEASFAITVDAVGTEPNAKVKVLLDGTPIHDAEVDGFQVIRKALPKGVHRLEAVIDGQDLFPQNDRYRTTVKAVTRPKVFLLTEHESPVASLLGQASDLTVGDRLPAGNLSEYTAIIINNVAAPRLEQDLGRLIGFVTSGNGLFMVGGYGSFERGGYQQSALETLLPFYVGTAGKQEGDVNVGLVLDISASTGTSVGNEKAVDIEKALALNVLGQLRQDAQVAAVAFNSRAFVVAEPRRLYEHRPELEDKISRLQDGGGTMMATGIAKAVELIRPLPGSKNLVIISDGITGGATVVEDLVEQASIEGIRTYTIGVGNHTNEDFMVKIATLGGGTYFEATAANRISLLLGDLDARRGEGENPEVVFVDRSHFITSGSEPKAKLAGWNSVVPRTTARLLAVTSAGDPLLAVWKFGLGRVAVLATDDGTAWAGPLLGGDGGKFLTRTMNWAIGDPERANPVAFKAESTRAGEPAEVIIRSPAPPNVPGTEFASRGDGTYTATVTPGEPGFSQVGDAVIAVNHPREYDTGPLDPTLEALVLGTGGRLFGPGQHGEIAPFVRQQLTYESPVQDDLQGPLLLAAIGIFLIEILFRRMLRSATT